MKIKSYFAATVAEAIAHARAELGPEAMIVASRKTGPEAMHLGAYEVVFGSVESKHPIPAAADNATQVHTKVSEFTDKPVGGNVTSLFKRKKPTEETSTFESPELARAQAMLLSAGFGAELTEELLQAVKKHIAGKEDRIPDAFAALAAELVGMLQISPELGRPRAPRRIVALVGPPGVGKTSTLVKLAVNYGLTGRQPMHIISVEGNRLGGCEQLRAYAAAMSTSFQSVGTVAALAQALEEHESKKVILIDTPGYGAADVEEFSHFASYLSRNAEIDVHLVLPAYMQSEDMDRAGRRFRPFLPSKLLFSMLDETTSTGPLLAHALKTATPISFLSIGQGVPEDLEPASAVKLVQRYLPDGQRTAAESVA